METYVATGLNREEAEEYVQSLRIQDKIEQRMKSLGSSSNSQKTHSILESVLNDKIKRITSPK